GFRVKSKYDVLASTDDSSTVINRNSAICVHCCCESGNLLSRLVSEDRVTMVYITAESDFTNESTVDRVIKSINTSADVFVLLFSMHRRIIMAKAKFGLGTS
ncbi:MAG: hypothetical protein ACKPKO_05125, partial [Candidatus Fonsibacter sp.]